MKAMILAAGLGTRLRPLTLVRPKVLVPIMGLTVLDFWVDRLRAAGCTGVVINAFQLHEKLVQAVRSRDWPIPVEVRVEPFLLGTGGGIRNVLDFFGDEPFVVINGDILCNAPLGVLYERHVQSGALVSLLLHDCPAFNNVAVENGGSIVGFGSEAKELGRESGSIDLMAFTGIHFINPGVLDELPAVGCADILALYREHIRKGHPPKCLQEEGLYWREMGSIDAYRNLILELPSLPEGCLPPLDTGEAVWIHQEAQIGPRVSFSGTVVVGGTSRIVADASLEDVIVWDGAVIGRGARLHRCIVADNARVSGSHADEVLV